MSAMVPPKDFEGTKEAIGHYQKALARQADAIDTLQRACVCHLSLTLPYKVMALPDELPHPELSFSGHVLSWCVQWTDARATYDRYVYEPLRTLKVEVATLPKDLFGEPI